jgi:hypothetical protein
VRGEDVENSSCERSAFFSENKMKRTKSTIAAGIFLIFGANAWADSGTFEAVTSMTSNWTTMQHLDGTVTIGSQIGTSTDFNVSGGLFVEGGSGIFECLVYIRKTSAGMDLESSCTTTHASGDKSFMMIRRKAGDIAEGGGGEGVSTFVGGTGRFEGITGRCTYTVDYLSDHKSVSISKCSWQQP